MSSTPEWFQLPQNKVAVRAALKIFSIVCIVKLNSTFPAVASQ